MWDRWIEDASVHIRFENKREKAADIVSHVYLLCCLCVRFVFLEVKADLALFMDEREIEYVTHIYFTS